MKVFGKILLFFSVRRSLHHLRELLSRLTCIWFHCLRKRPIGRDFCDDFIFQFEIFRHFSFQGHMVFVISYFLPIFPIHLTSYQTEFVLLFFPQSSVEFFSMIFLAYFSHKKPLCFSFANQIFVLKLKKQMKKIKKDILRVYPCR